MKKLMIFSLMISGAFVGNTCFADGGQVCPDGSTVCGITNPGGPMESNKCQNKDGSYKTVGSVCSPANAPANSGHCIASNIPGQTSCAAKECNNDYLLYTTLGRYANLKVKTGPFERTEGRKVASQGICRRRSDLQNECDNGCGCAQNEVCVLKTVIVENDGKSVPAYIGDEKCVCISSVAEPEEPVIDNERCTTTIDINVQCTDGIHYLKNKEVYSTTEEEAKDCTKWEKILKEKINSFSGKPVSVSDSSVISIAELNELINSVCGGNGGNAGGQSGGASGITQAEIENARLKMEAFFKTAQDEASVWKTESGNFNGARLASDLTAGVVLGTVGGIVTGNIIKKNQIKKGYEVLHCTIGGQTVADWGDEFNVGLRR